MPLKIINGIAMLQQKISIINYLLFNVPPSLSCNNKPDRYLKFRTKIAYDKHYFKFSIVGNLKFGYQIIFKHYGT